MGTGYDCSDLKAQHQIVSDHARAAQDGAMCWWRRWRSQGFVNYFREWWHFSLPGAGGQAYDFPIKRRN